MYFWSSAAISPLSGTTYVRYTGKAGCHLADGMVDIVPREVAAVPVSLTNLSKEGRQTIYVAAQEIPQYKKLFVLANRGIVS